MPINQNDLHFLQMAQLQGQKSQFSRKKRGCVIVKNNKVIATGVNSHLNPNTGAQHLANVTNEERYVATVNAEVVALGTVVKAGIHLEGTTIYSSDCPQWNVWKMLAMMGIKRIVHYGPNNNDLITEYSQQLGVETLAVG